MSYHPARRAPVQQGRAAWSVILGDPAPPHLLEADAHADFAVIGAGFAGLSAARRLKQLEPNAKIAVIDAGRVGDGAAGRNSGFMIDLPHNLPSEGYDGIADRQAMTALNRQAQAFAGDAVEDYGIDPNFFDRAGKINGAATEATLAINEDEHRQLGDIGEASEMLDAKQMAEITGCRYYRGGLYTPGTVMLQPAGYVRGFAAGLARDGVDIYENSPVTGFRKDKATWRVETTKGAVVAPKIILAVNGHLESFGFVPGRLMHLFLFGAMTPELSPDQVKTLGGHSRWGITPADAMGATVRRIDSGQGGNRIVIRAAAALRSNMAATARDVARAHRSMAKRFDARFPALRAMKVEHVWAGHLCLSMNGVAVMREVEDGVFSACVQNGLGTARGTLTGMGAAELACGRTSDITRRFTAEDAPTKLAPQPFRDVGGNVVLRWREWKARRA